MKFARFEHQGNIYCGIADADRITVIKGHFWNDFSVTDQKYPISEIELLPPVMPTKIVCVGQNYRGHIEELGVPVPKEPLIFFKPPSCLVGHKRAIIYHRDAERIDYEGELAIVIKDKMRNVDESETLNHVLGYTCFNDVTERKMVGNNPLLLSIAKGFDTFGPIGPYIETDLDPNRLTLKTYLNGELKQRDVTANCVFSVQVVLSFISRYITLLPGDIVTTGTPRGIAPMKPGDRVEVEIDGIGCLSNRVQSDRHAVGQ